MHSKERLMEMISILSSEGEKVRFLQSAYVPGYKAAFELLFEIEKTDLDIEILVQEMNYDFDHAIESPVMENAAKSIIDRKARFRHFPFSDEAKLWKNKKFMVYALDAFFARVTDFTFDDEYDFRNNERLDDLSRVAELFRLWSPDDPREQALSRKVVEVLKTIKWKDQIYERLSDLPQALVDAKMYDEAIDSYLSAPKGENTRRNLAKAWEIARDLVPKRRNAVARKLMVFAIKSLWCYDGWTVHFLEASDALGLKMMMRVLLMKNRVFGGKERISPCIGLELVRALQKFGGMELVIPSVIGCLERVNLDSTDAYEDCLDLVKFNHAIGDFQKAKEWLGQAADIVIEKRGTPAGKLRVVEECAKLIGDSSVKAKFLHLFESTKDYESAAKIAEEIGMTEKASAYREMALMVKK